MLETAGFKSDIVEIVRAPTDVLLSEQMLSNTPPDDDETLLMLQEFHNSDVDDIEPDINCSLEVQTSPFSSPVKSTNPRLEYENEPDLMEIARNEFLLESLFVDLGSENPAALAYINTDSFVDNTITLLTGPLMEVQEPGVAKYMFVVHGDSISLTQITFLTLLICRSSPKRWKYRDYFAELPIKFAEHVLPNIAPERWTPARLCLLLSKLDVGQYDANYEDLRLMEASSVFLSWLGVLQCVIRHQKFRYNFRFLTPLVIQP